MMKVLWLTGTYRFQKDSDKNVGYNGGGWIISLLHLVKDSKEIDLGIAYLTSSPNEKVCIIDGISYFPVYTKQLSKWEKIKKYYGGYKKINYDTLSNKTQTIITEFKPDIIYLFGIENPMATILGKTNVPVLVHLQGILGPCYNAFFPQGFNKSSFMYPITIKEWVLRNGFIYAYNNLKVRTQTEKKLFAKLAFCTGRTEWDKQISKLMAPHSNYFHVDEVLRNSFYENAGKWDNPKGDYFIITSTISETVYKGLDTILKTARLLKDQTNLKIIWQIVGVNRNSNFVLFFEKKLGINSNDIGVKYLGVQDEQTLCQTLLSSNVYVHPSYIDNSPNSIGEAQILGIPVIGTYVGGIPSLIKHQESGILVPANAPYELAQWLKLLSKNVNTCKYLSENGFKTAMLRHDKNKILDDLTHIYKSIIESHAHS